MNSKELKIVIEIYKDCLKLRRRKELTEYGRGQLSLCKILLSIKA